MNTDKVKVLGDYLGLFNYPQLAVAQPMAAPGMPVVYAQQMPAGQVAQAAPPQGMVQLSAAPVPPQQVAQQPQPQYVAPQPAPQPAGASHLQLVPAVNIGQPTTPAAVPVGVDDLVRQNEAYRLQIAQQQATTSQQVAQQQQAEIAAMKPMERLEARIQLLQDQNNISTERANQWRIDSARKEVELRHNGRINTNHLDTSSVEALEASIPRALSSYADLENSIASRIRQEIGMDTHRAVEGLPPAPGMVGLPASNRGGAVPQGAPQQAGYQPGNHPMMQNNYLQYTPNAAHGRVYQPQGPMPSPMPAAGGQMFPPQYPQYPQQQQQMGYAPQPQQGYASPPVQLVPQQMMGQPQGMQQQGMQQQDIELAKATARASIMSARKGGSAALAAQGLREPHSQSMALSAQGGQQPINHGAMPDPAAFIGQGMHPMHLASGGV